MKTLFFSIVASLVLCLPVEAQTKASASSGSQRIHIKFGRVSKDCRGFGICEFSIDMTIGELIDVVQVINNMGNLKVAISPQNMERNRSSFSSNMMVIEEDYVVPTATAKALGLRSFTIKKGKYPMVFDSKTNTYNCTFN